jgi:hypothetical protein
MRIKSFKLFESESYYSDDINVELTSNVIDILQDFIDEGLNIECFTVGYITLKRAGVTYSDNDILLSIMANHEDDLIDFRGKIFSYKTLDFKSLKPYLKRVCEYMESEGRHYVVTLQYRIKSKVRGKFGSMEQTDDITNIDYIDENIAYESISFKFKL